MLQSQNKMQELNYSTLYFLIISCKGKNFLFSSLVFQLYNISDDFFFFVSVSLKAVEGIISNLTLEPFGPLMRSTTSSILQPITSTISPSSSCPTPIILSSGFRRSVFQLAHQVLKMILRYKVHLKKERAPIPSRERLMFISKSSEVLGDI